MRISTKLSNEERHYINNLLISGTGELPDKEGKVSDKATHMLVVDKGFIVGAKKVIRNEDKK